MRLQAAIRLVFAASIGLVASLHEARSSDAFPTRPLTIVVGFTPGGSSDTGARMLAEKLSPRLGQPVLVENKPGAGGMLATTQTLQKPADGYTLLFLASAHTVTAAMRQSMTFDPVEDLEWISTVATYGMVFGVRQDSSFRTLQDLIVAAKSKPRSMTYYSVGHGTGHHLLGEWLNAAAGIEMTHVPYRGSGAALSDFMSGRVDLMIDTMTFAYPQVQAGAVRPLAVTSRSVPTEMEKVPFSGDVVPGVQYESWLGVAVRKGTPQEVVDRLRKEVVSVVKSEEFQRDISRLGANATPSTGNEFKERVGREIAEFGRVIAARNIERQQ